MKLAVACLLLAAIALSSCVRSSKSYDLAVSSSTEVSARVGAAKRLSKEEHLRLTENLLEVIERQYSSRAATDALSVLAEIGDSSVADVLVSDRYREQRKKDEGSVNAILEDVAAAIRARAKPNQQPRQQRP